MIAFVPYCSLTTLFIYSLSTGSGCGSEYWNEFGPLEAALRMPLLVTENEKGGQEVYEGRGTVCVGWLSVLKP